MINAEHVFSIVKSEDESIQEIVDTPRWVDIDVAKWCLGAALGIFKVPGSRDFKWNLEDLEINDDFRTKLKWIFYTDNPLGDKLNKMLESLVEIGYLEKNDQSQFRVRLDYSAFWQKKEYARFNMIAQTHFNSRDLDENEEICPDCDGEGFLGADIENMCHRCKGTGLEQTLTVEDLNIPFFKKHVPPKDGFGAYQATPKSIDKLLHKSS